MQRYHFFIMSRIYIFLWSLGGWILATRNWGGSGEKGGSLWWAHTERQEGHWGPEDARVPGGPVRRRAPKGQRGSARRSSTGGPAARRLGQPRGLAEGQDAEHSPATVGHVSFHCWRLQWGGVYCLHTLLMKENPAFVHPGVQAISETRNVFIFKHQPQITGR